MFVWWRSNLINLYNDAYIPVLGKRHPDALGQPAASVWSEIWHVLGPQAEAVLTTGQATWNEDLLLVMERNAYTEETYFTFSYSPAFDDQGGVNGVFCACTEETTRVLGERRLGTLRTLAAQAALAKSTEAAGQLSAEALATNPYDLPFALIYLQSAEGRLAKLAGAAGLPPGLPASPDEVSLETGSGAPWPFLEARAEAPAVAVTDLAARFGPLTGGAWPEPTASALVLPIAQPGQGGPAGWLVAGLSPRRPLDDDYRGFLELAAGQLATAFANARAYEAERERAEALAELDRAKTAFFNNVSHEFRTPLTLMVGPLDELSADPALPAEVKARLDVVQRNGQRLLKLVNVLLDFARLEAGRVQAVYAPVDLATLTADLASAFRAATERAGLRLVIDCPRPPEPAYVDRDMWEKIVLNLLSNAFKHTFAGEIRVILRAAGGSITLAVQDTGTGIPPDEVPHLFERFHRVRSAQARTHEGAGIGLALVQELARLHGGSVGVESRLGQGSTFTVTIPAGRAHLPAERVQALASLPAAAALQEPYMVEEAWSWLPERADADQPPEAGAETRPEARILLADDNADMRAYLRRLLARHWEVEAVPDGRQALAAARATVPDLVLADVMMPGLDGFELLRRLRQDARTRTVPIILLSARAGEEARVEGLEAGADDYLIKPFSARELLARVRAQLELARLRDEAAQQERVAQAAVAELRDRRRAEDEQRQLAEQLRALSARLQAVREDERTRIAREVHDVLGQQLTGLRLDLTQLYRTWPAQADSAGRERLAGMTALIDETIQTVRRIATDLRPAVLDDFGLVAAIEWQLEDFQRRSGIICRLATTLEHVEVDRETATAVFRILQETLTNVARHAQASEVFVRLALDEAAEAIVLEVEDNGQGIHPARLAGTQSLGLIGMRERAELLAGEFAIQGQPGRGTTVRVRIPRRPAPAASY